MEDTNKTDDNINNNPNSTAYDPFKHAKTTEEPIPIDTRLEPEDIVPENRAGRRFNKSKGKKNGQKFTWGKAGRIDINHRKI